MKKPWKRDVRFQGFFCVICEREKAWGDYLWLKNMMMIPTMMGRMMIPQMMAANSVFMMCRLLPCFHDTRGRGGCQLPQIGRGGGGIDRKSVV